MWMMGYNDGGELNLPDSFTGRKLRPLIPRPAATSTTSTTTATNNNNYATTNNNNYATTNPPCLSRIHGTDLLAFNHHLATVAEQSKREFNAQQVVVSSRWNPTPEQLQTLEELYRRGTRTPSADQIQHITAQLRQYGKIEGKNVFYWFQNHKARERQKRRRQLESVSSDECCGRDTESNERKEHAGGNRTAAGFEVEQTKSSSSWALPRNFTTLVPAASQKTASMQKAAAAAMSAAEAEATVPPECRTDGWAQFDDDERELHQRRSLLFEGNATWHMMQLSSPSSSPPTNPTTTTSTTLSTPSQSLRTMDQIFMTKNFQDLNNTGGGDDRGGEEGGGGGGGASDHTLQLFPLRSGGDGDEKEKMNTGLTPYQFFEFLPLKN